MMDLETSTLALFKLPLKLINGQIFDQNGKQVLTVRGWNYFQNIDGGLRMQDSLGEMVVKAFNEKYHKPK